MYEIEIKMVQSLNGGTALPTLQNNIICRTGQVYHTFFVVVPIYLDNAHIILEKGVKI